MLGLLKKVVNYFTLDEEAEVERAAAASPIVISDDESNATQPASGKKLHSAPSLPTTRSLATTRPVRSIPSVPAEPTVLSVSSDEHVTGDFEYSYPEIGQLGPKKRKRTVRSAKPGEGKFKISLPTTNGIPEDSARGYDMDGNPVSRPGQNTTSTTNTKPGRKKTTTPKPTKKTTSAAAHKLAKKTTAKTTSKSTAEYPVSNGVATTSIRLTIPGIEHQTAAEREKEMEEANQPKKGKRGRPKLEQDDEHEFKVKKIKRNKNRTAEKRTTKGRAQKLGDHQCLYCGETFFDLPSRDDHVRVEHPKSSHWKH